MYNTVRFLMCFVFFLSASVRSQDIASVEAFIDDHKRVRSVLIARSSVEQANEVLHKYSQDLHFTYDSINLQLDRYTKCFDVIDVIFNLGLTAVNVIDVSNDLSDRVSKLNTLLQEFTEVCVLRGNIMSSDTIVLNVCHRAVESARTDVSSLLSSFYELAQYVSGLRHITTEGFMEVMGNVNTALFSLRSTIDRAYLILWRYITVRTHWFKKSIYMSKDVREMANEAFSRWRWATRNIDY